MRTFNAKFNFSRFLKLIRSLVIVERKTLVLYPLAVFAGYVLVMFLFLFNRTNWPEREWEPLFALFTVPVALIFAGFGFHMFRTKEKTFEFLMIPGSLGEKFMLEFLLRIILPWLVLPVLFWLASITTPLLVSWLSPKFMVNNIPPFSLSSPMFQSKLLVPMVFMFLLSQSMMFAGSSSFTRVPVIKTLLFLGLCVLVAFSYIYFLYGILELKGEPALFHLFDKEDKERLIIILLGISIIVSWTYSLFKLKEKQVV